MDRGDEAREVLAEVLASTLIPIAKDVKIQVEFNPGQVSEYRLIGYETRILARQDFDDDRVDAGEIGSGHTMTALYESAPTGALLAAQQAEARRYATAHATTSDVAAGNATTGNATTGNDAADAVSASLAVSDEVGFLRLRYTLPNETVSQEISRPIGMGEVSAIEQASADVQFAAAVAGFAQRLRNSSSIDERFGYEQILRILGSQEAQEATDRREFLQLVERAAALSGEGDGR